MDSTVIMTGRLGKDVDSRVTRNGADYASFRLASSQRINREGQWMDGETTWVTVKCFRQLATNATMSLRKGQPVVVAGKLRVEKWVTDAGVERESTVLEAQAIGHDLNWGVTKFSRLEKERVEPDAEAPPEPEDEGISDESDAPAGPDPENDCDPDTVREAEALLATVGAPIGAR